MAFSIIQSKERANPRVSERFPVGWTGSMQNDPLRLMRFRKQDPLGWVKESEAENLKPYVIDK